RAPLPGVAAFWTEWGARAGSAPAELDELCDAIGDALAAEEPLEVVGGGSKRGLGRPLQLPRMLDLSRLAGIRDYQPSELVLTAGAATPMEERSEERRVGKASRPERSTQSKQ